MLLPHFFNSLFVQMQCGIKIAFLCRSNGVTIIRIDRHSSSYIVILFILLILFSRFAKRVNYSRSIYFVALTVGWIEKSNIVISDDAGYWHNVSVYAKKKYKSAVCDDFVYLSAIIANVLNSECVRDTNRISVLNIRNEFLASASIFMI